MKRLIALILVVVLTVSALSICVFAASNSKSGKYKSRNYYGVISCSDTAATGSMRWEGTQYNVKCRVTLYSHNRKEGTTRIRMITSAPQQNYASIPVTVDTGCVADYADFDGIIGDVDIICKLQAYPGR